ncbi:MAG: hypothetical protein HN348_05040 [Proteobacteria bacterium]|jgi:hypothetical protein|nr:hypothetical protein [Pseudomonadota bacterium]
MYVALFLIFACTPADPTPGSEEPDQTFHDDDDDTDVWNQESGVILCSGQTCPFGECDESEEEGDCNAYDEDGYNVTNYSSLCANGSNGSYCLRTTEDGDYSFGEGQFFFVDCIDGSGESDSCLYGCSSFGCT